MCPLCHHKDWTLTQSLERLSKSVQSWSTASHSLTQDCNTVEEVLGSCRQSDSTELDRPTSWLSIWQFVPIFIALIIRIFFFLSSTQLRRMQEMIAQMQAQMRMKPGDEWGVNQAVDGRYGSKKWFGLKCLTALYQKKNKKKENNPRKIKSE